MIMKKMYLAPVELGNNGAFADPTPPLSMLSKPPHTTDTTKSSTLVADVGRFPGKPPKPSLSHSGKSLIPLFRSRPNRQADLT